MIARRLLVLSLVAASPLAGQESSPRYLPLTHWAMPYVEHLARTGLLRGLDPLTRPLRRADVLRALGAADTASAGEAQRSVVRELARDLAAPRDSAYWRLEAHLGAAGFSDPQRDPLRADSTGNRSRLVPVAGLAASLELPHFVAVTHPRIDNRLKYDSEYTGKKDRIVAGRNDEAYVAASWRYADVFFGIMTRNWGPPELPGLVLSSAPYGYDHLMLRLGPRRLRLEFLATELDDLRLFDSGFIARRFLSAHRLVVQPTDRLWVALSEAALYASSGGVTRSFEPWYLNPANLFLLGQYNDLPTANSLLGVEASWLAGPSLRLFAQAYVDDFQVDRAEQGDREPGGNGLSLGASGGALGGTAGWSAFYTRVTNLAYRTPANEEQYTVRGVGLARAFDDYDQLTVRVQALAPSRLLMGGELTVLRQGEGRIARRYPDVSLYDDSLSFLTGTVERTVRAGLQAVWNPRPGISLSADVARHFIANARHVAGDNRGRWVWRLGAEARPSRWGRAPR
jgi:hypothetical protein